MSREEVQHAVMINTGGWYQIKVTVKQQITAADHSLCSMQYCMSSHFANLIPLTQVPWLKTEIGMGMSLLFLRYPCGTQIYRKQIIRTKISLFSIIQRY